MAKDLERIYIPLWRAMCRKLSDHRLTDEDVGKIIRVAIEYDINDLKEPSETGILALDLICTELCLDIDKNRAYMKTRSDAGRAGANARWKNDGSNATDQEIEDVAHGINLDYYRNR